MAEEKKDPKVEVDENEDGSAHVRMDGAPEPKESRIEATDDDQDDDADGADDEDDKVIKADDAADVEGDEPEGETLEAKRARRKKERVDRRDRQRAKEEATNRKLRAAEDQAAQLAARLAALEQRGSSADLASLDAAIKQKAEAVAFYRGQIAQGISAGDGAAVADATERMTTARLEGERLVNFKTTTQQQQRQTVTQPSQVDPRVVRHANEWLASNSWYDPDKGDDDSRITYQLDLGVKQRGFTPDTPEYWQELNAQVAKYLPHRVKPKPRPNANGRSPVDGSGRENGAARPGTILLSKERVQAMKEAGVWNDDVKKAKAIKSYMDYDKQNQGKRA